ncbi:hypothetical protein PDE_07732 [Penicillium oxalicum 114-2]|uniref:Uncharacterized protein n=1 Tax=Penicillium oxalicum (strain 114-2 / CGMCC 5302) TaxID=933388 RepID=S8BCV2_PENO1|nr:hypothetical protein PDE_07732 [Penicillium oxalicum 114-2]
MSFRSMNPGMKARIWTANDEKLHLLWLYLSTREADKPDHAIVAKRLGITPQAVARRYVQIKEEMVKMDRFMASSIEARKKLDFGVKLGQISEILEELDWVFSKGEVLR